VRIRETGRRVPAMTGFPNRISGFTSIRLFIISLL
jgi:hypothetical protein